jgi:microcystin-dependent protein
MDGYLGQLLLWAGNYAPENWAFCEGQLLNVREKAALYSLLGTYYGGDGSNNFALPDLRGATINGSKVNETPGSKLGAIGVSLNSTHLPAHTHTWSGATEKGSLQSPANGFVADTTNPSASTVPDKDYASSGTVVALAAGTIANAGGGQPVPVMQPSLGVRYIICTEGYYPQRS